MSYRLAQLMIGVRAVFVIAGDTQHSRMRLPLCGSLGPGIECPQPVGRWDIAPDGSFATFNAAFTSSECEMITSLAKEGLESHAIEKGFRQVRTREFFPAGSMSPTDSTFNPQWLVERVLTLAHAGNKRVWDFGLGDVLLFRNQGVASDVWSVLEYQADGTSPGMYEWHIDNDHRKSMHSGRVLSVVVQLSAPADYEGGSLQIGDRTVSAEQGSITIFPSFIAHRVSPVSFGTRFAMVAFLQGLPDSGSYPSGSWFYSAAQYRKTILDNAPDGGDRQDFAKLQAQLADLDRKTVAFQVMPDGQTSKTLHTNDAKSNAVNVLFQIQGSNHQIYLFWQSAGLDKEMMFGTLPLKKPLGLTSIPGHVWFLRDGPTSRDRVLMRYVVTNEPDQTVFVADRSVPKDDVQPLRESTLIGFLAQLLGFSGWL